MKPILISFCCAATVAAQAASVTAAASRAMFMFGLLLAAKSSERARIPSSTLESKHAVRHAQWHPRPVRDSGRRAAFAHVRARRLSLGDLALDGRRRQARVAGDGRAREPLAPFHL